MPTPTMGGRVRLETNAEKDRCSARIGAFDAANGRYDFMAFWLEKLGVDDPRGSGLTFSEHCSLAILHPMTGRWLTPAGSSNAPTSLQRSRRSSNERQMKFTKRAFDLIRGLRRGGVAAFLFPRCRRATLRFVSTGLPPDDRCGRCGRRRTATGAGNPRHFDKTTGKGFGLRDAGQRGHWPWRRRYWRAWLAVQAAWRCAVLKADLASEIRLRKRWARRSSGFEGRIFARLDRIRSELDAKADK